MGNTTDNKIMPTGSRVIAGDEVLIEGVLTMVAGMEDRGLEGALPVLLVAGGATPVHNALHFRHRLIWLLPMKVWGKWMN